MEQKGHNDLVIVIAVVVVVISVLVVLAVDELLSFFVSLLILYCM
jgi:hypothetical protein